MFDSDDFTATMMTMTNAERHGRDQSRAEQSRAEPNMEPEVSVYFKVERSLVAWSPPTTTTLPLMDVVTTRDGQKMG